MYPIIFSLGPVTIYTYGVAMLTAFFAALFVVWKRGREAHFDEEELFDAVVVVMLWMLVAARLGYVLLHLDDFGFNPLRWINVIGQPGWWWLMGFVGGGMGLVWQARKRRWEVYSVADVVVVGLILAQAIMALGAFLNGSGYGVATDWFIGMRFPNIYDKRIPVQMFEMIAYGSLFGLMWWVENEYRTFAWYKGAKSEANSGFILAVYLMGVGFWGVCFSLMRPAVVQIGDRSIDYVVYLLMFIWGVGVMVSRSGLNVKKGWGEKWGNLGRKREERKKNMGKNKPDVMNLGEDWF